MRDCRPAEVTEKREKKEHLINKPHDVSQQMMLIMIEKLLANHGNIP